MRGYFNDDNLFLEFLGETVFEMVDFPYRRHDCLRFLKVKILNIMTIYYTHSNKTYVITQKISRVKMGKGGSNEELASIALPQ